MAEPGGAVTAPDAATAKPLKTYTFHLPDGKTADQQAPEGTPTETVWSWVVKQHPEYGQRQQSTGRFDPPGRDPNAPDPVGFIAGLGQGIADLPEGAGQLIQKGGEAFGVDPSRLVPGFVQRGAEALKQRAGASTAGQVGETIGGFLPFLLQPELGFLKAGQGIQKAAPYIERLLKPAGRVATRSTLPSVLQPTDTNDPNFWQTKGKQALVGTGFGEVLQQLGRLAGIPLQRWAKQDVADAGARRAQEAADRLNQKNTLQYDAAQRQHQIDLTKQADIPRQAVRDVLNDARHLIGLRPLEMNATRQAAPETLKVVGDEMGRIYGRMNFDPNLGGWMATAQRVQANIDNFLRQDPNAQALWQQVFQDKAFMPALRAEAGAGAPVKGVMPGVVRTPTGERYPVSVPSGDVQGPMGTRSGPVSGDQLSLLMSKLTQAQHQFGLAAQRGGGAVMDSIANGLRDMRESIDQQLSARFPKAAKDLEAAKQAYYLTSRVVDAVDPHGAATPDRLLKAFQDAEGKRRFGTDKRFADVKDRLEAQHKEHTTKLDPPKPPVTVKGPGTPPSGAHPGMSWGTAHAASHLVPGGHMARAVARELLHQAGRGATEPVLKRLSRAGRLGPAAAAAGGQFESQPQELVVTPRGATWQDIPIQRRP